VLSEAAMTNAYYICHNVQVLILSFLFMPNLNKSGFQDLLFNRGFYWEGAAKKGKKKGKGRKKEV